MILLRLNYISDGFRPTYKYNMKPTSSFMQLQHFRKETKYKTIIKDMTEELEIAGISTGTWWNSPTNAASAVFSSYSLPRSTEISLDITNFGWQNFDNKINDHDDDYNMNMPTSQISSWNQSIM